MKLNKKQKRTATIASMAALLAVVLGMGGQTFAKYYESHSVSTDKAVVAKWGYVIQATSDNDNSGTDSVELFKTTYGDNAVVSADSTQVIAPGTSGEVKFTITGTAEVKSNIAFTADFTSFSNPGYTSGSEKYYPIVWKVNGEVTPFDGLSAKFASLNETVPANTSYAPSAPKTFTLSWTWEFNNGKDDEDTIMGRLSEIAQADDLYENGGNVTLDGKTYEYTREISFNASLSITQAEI